LTACACYGEKPQLACDPHRDARKARGIRGECCIGRVEHKRRHLDECRCGLARIDAVDRIEPPLQPDLADRWIADRLADSGKLYIERVEGEEMWPQGLRREQAGQKAVPVALADEVEAVSLGGLGRFPAP
jgi:hypothetical protein